MVIKRGLPIKEQENLVYKAIGEERLKNCFLQFFEDVEFVQAVRATGYVITKCKKINAYCDQFVDYREHDFLEQIQQISDFLNSYLLGYDLRIKGSIAERDDIVLFVIILEH